MRRVGLPVLLVVFGLLVGLAACSDDGADGADDGRTSEESTPVGPEVEATGAPLEVSLELTSDEVAAGESVAGTVHVRNTTDEPLVFTTDGDVPRTTVPYETCEASVGAGIARPEDVEEARQSVFFTLDCRPPPEVAPGDEVTYDVTLQAATIDPDTGDPVPYEPGEYVAWIVIDPELPFAPVPDPTPITVTA